MILKGIDQIKKYDHLLKNKRIGLITSVSAVDRNLRMTLDIIRENYHLVALFAPEHGIRGNMKAGEVLESYMDLQTGIMVYSLYRKESKTITSEMLDSIDVLIYDIQDIGVRYYTYISTMIMALKKCSEDHKKFIVLDRPNPLGGVKIEGEGLDMNYSSFVGAYNLPVRYGLTIGELALMVNEECKYGCDLTVIHCQGWKREMRWDSSKQIWIMPSPNIPNYLTAELYVGMCLFEGTILSEGRGTAYPFGTIGAPFINGQQLCKLIKAEKIPGLSVTPAYFSPTTSKFKDEACEGIHFHITDLAQFESYQTAIRIIEIIKDLFPRKNIFLKPNKTENQKEHRPFISLLAGSNIFETKDWKADCYIRRCRKSQEDFLQRKQQFHIYK